MKKLLVFALAAVSMVACVKEEVTLLPQGDAISFESAFIDNATRAAVDPSTTTATLDSFNVWGFVKEYDGEIFNAVDVTKNGNVWSYQGTQYWVPNQPYYFSALAPMDSANWGVTKATGDAAKLGLGTVSFANVDGSEDLLYAKEMMTSKGINETNGAVKFQFQHLLSKVKFTFKNGFPTETASVKVTNVKMTAPKNAEINLAQADYAKAWTSLANTTTLEFGDVETLAYTQDAEVAKERLTIPADAAYTYNIQFDVELFMGAQSVYTTSKTSVVTGAELEMGKAYNFTAEITPANLELEEIVFDVIAVEDWENAGDHGIYVGETVGVSTAAELVAAIADEDVTAVVLTEDIDLGSTTITRAEGAALTVEKKDFTIDGGGKTLTYNGSNRVIDFKAADGVVKNATIKNLTINIASSYCERGINFNNANGTLVVENVQFAGTAPTYAINFPGSADGAKATIKNSTIVGLIALNVWGEYMTIDVINSKLVSVDNTSAEGYSAVMLNNDGSTAAEHSVINIEGGEITAKNQDDEPATAVYNATETAKINISETTTVVGAIEEQVAIVDFGTNQFYGMTSLQDAIDYVADNNNGKVRVTKDIVLTKSVNVPAGATVEIDLNGKTISIVDTTEKNFELIKNAGTLTLVGGGKLTVEATINSGWSRYSAVVANVVGGNLTIKGGVEIEHLGGTDMAYGVDNLTNGKGTYAVTTIEDATIKSPYRAVRQFLNGVEATNELYVKAGAKLEGANKSIFFHDPSAKANTGKLVVEAGAELKGDVYLFVTAGSTEWPVEVSIADAALVGESEVISANVPAGYAVISENGVVKVAETTSANDQNSLNAAVAQGGYVALEAGNYTMPAVNGQELSINGTEDVVITVNKPNMSGSDITFNGVTIKGSGYSTGVQHVNTVTYNNAKILGEMCLYGEKVVFNNCTFELANGQYIWVYGAKNAEFHNCVFNTAGKAILIYNEGAGANDVVVEGCTFNASAGAKAGAIANQNCAAIEIDNFQSAGVGAAHKLTAEGNTFGANFSGVWRIKNFVAGNAITVNGVAYTQIAVDGKLMTIDASKNVTVL